jgi:hypothetical protein
LCDAASIPFHQVDNSGVDITGQKERPALSTGYLSTTAAVFGAALRLGSGARDAVDGSKGNEAANARE